MYLASRRARMMAAVVAAAGIVLPGAGAAPQVSPAVSLGPAVPATPTVRAAAPDSLPPPSAVWVVRPLGNPAAVTSGGRFTTSGYERDPSAFGSGLRGVLTGMAGTSASPGATLSDLSPSGPSAAPAVTPPGQSQDTLGHGELPAVTPGVVLPSLPATQQPQWRWEGYGAPNPTPALKQLHEKGITPRFDAPAPRLPAPAPVPTLPEPTPLYRPGVTPPAPATPPPAPAARPVTLPPTGAPVSSVLGPPPPPVPSVPAQKMPLLPPTGTPVPPGSGTGRYGALPSQPTAARPTAQATAQPGGPTLPPTGSPLPAGYRPAGYNPGQSPATRSVVPAVNHVAPGTPQPVRPAYQTQPAGGAAYSKDPAPAAGLSTLTPPPAPLVRGTSAPIDGDEIGELRRRIEGVCAGKGFGVAVRKKAIGVLEVGFRVARSADAEPLVNLLSSLPELDSWRVDFEVRVGP